MWVVEDFGLAGEQLEETGGHAQSVCMAMGIAV